MFKRSLLVIFSCLLIYSCHLFESEEEDLKTSSNVDTQPQSNSKNFSPIDVINDLLNDYKFVSQSCNHNQFSSILDDFRSRNIDLHKVKNECETVFQISSESNFVRIRSWTFKNENEAEKLVKILENGTYEKSGLTFDEIKEPHFWMIENETVYLFYTENVSQAPSLFDIQKRLSK